MKVLLHRLFSEFLFHLYTDFATWYDRTNMFFLGSENFKAVIAAWFCILAVMPPSFSIHRCFTFHFPPDSSIFSYCRIFEFLIVPIIGWYTNDFKEPDWSSWNRCPHNTLNREWRYSMVVIYRPICENHVFFIIQLCFYAKIGLSFVITYLLWKEPIGLFAGKFG